jgi:para-aminobenzoate synthetase component 1
LFKHEIQYFKDSTRYFEQFASQPWSCFLDSGGSDRYDIIVSDPFLTVTGYHDRTVVEGALQYTTDEQPFNVLENLMQGFPQVESDLPFSGGAVGYFAYELGALNKANHTPAKNTNIPLMMVGIYDWALIVDHQEEKAFIVSHGLDVETQNKWSAYTNITAAPQNNIFKTDARHMRASMSYSEYKQAFDKVQQYLNEGDCYQVNLSNKFETNVEGDSWTAYKSFREINRTPFMSYLKFKDFEVLCGSPERFIKVDNGIIKTQPIKGTRPRGKNNKEDIANAQELMNSDKDKSENLMIVDLLRNDLGINCEIGTIKVTELFELRTFSNVHHLVSTITGKLKTNAIRCLKDCFPGGSITGAPKSRSMQIINEIEPHSRGIYCGSIGYIGFNQKMDTNIAIRTAVCKDNKLEFCGGGGIVAQSTSFEEYTEIDNKISNINFVIKLYKSPRF